MRPRINPSEAKRILILDVFRGFAIFGIFVVNIEIMNCFLVEQDSCYLGQSGFLDRLADEIRRVLFYTKFFPIFSMLFGLGIGLQLLNLAQKKLPVWPFVSRRMWWLLLIGIAHILFLWTGDVVHIYAVIGMTGPLLFKWTPRALLWVSILVLLIFPWLMNPVHELLEAVISDLGGLSGEEFKALYPEGTISTIMRQGSYGEQVELRSQEYWTNAPFAWSYFAPLAFSMFVLGLFLAQTKAFVDFPAFARKIKNPMLFMAVITNLFRLFFIYVVLDRGWHRMEGIGPLLLGIMPVCDAVMGLFYLWLIAYFFPRLSGLRITNGFAAVGRTALSNYILQSIIGLVLLSSAGFGLYSELTKWNSLLIALGVFPLQMLLSWLWLRHFRFGPLEWAWRCLTYWRVFPLRR